MKQFLDNLWAIVAIVIMIVVAVALFLNGSQGGSH